MNNINIPRGKGAMDYKGIQGGADLEQQQAKTLLMIGGQIDASLVKKNNLDLSAFDNYVKARHWVENCSREEAASIYAILIDLDLVRAGNYSLLQLIRKHPVFAHVPFIVLCPEGSEVDHSLALSMGVDDCYSAPLQWEDIFRRIAFLKDFKAELRTGNPASESRFDHRIPAAKRLFDIAVAGTALLLLSPILLMIALIIRLESKGSIFYISKRAGSGYDVFDFYKFRSMRQDADKELQNLMHLNQYGEGDAAFVKIENDPRITRFGSFLRNTSLDELPQLFNVLKGDMSIVGNRPLPLYEAEMLTNDVSAGRFLAPAGITGLWQVTKRGGEEMSISERIALDIEYARNYSLIYDLKIIAKTIPALLQQASV